MNLDHGLWRAQCKILQEEGGEGKFILHELLVFISDIIKVHSILVYPVD